MNYQDQNCQCGNNGKMDRLLNQLRVAEILSVCPKTLEYWRWKGGGPVYIKVGKLVRYRESDVQAYIEQLACES